MKSLGFQAPSACIRTRSFAFLQSKTVTSRRRYQDAKNLLASGQREGRQLSPDAMNQLRYLCFYLREREGLPAQKEFFHVLNADVKMVCEFRANNVFYCLEQFDAITMILKALIERSQTAKEEKKRLKKAKDATGLAKLRTVKVASELKVEAQQLAVAYDHLSKLTKLIDACVFCFPIVCATFPAHDVTPL
jgi:hypothetical protein